MGGDKCGACYAVRSSRNCSVKHSEATAGTEFKCCSIPTLPTNADIHGLLFEVHLHYKVVGIYTEAMKDTKRRAS